MHHSVTTPGGFFVGLGGIAAFCVVTAGIYCLVKSSNASEELRPQQVALGLAPAADAKKEVADKKHAEVKSLLEAAAAKYNGGKRPDLDNLDDLRGVVRYRESKKAAEAAETVLNANSIVEGRTVIEAAIVETAKELAAKPVTASKVAIDLAPPPQKGTPVLPNLQGGGVKTMLFADPSKPAAPPVPAPAAAPAAPPAPGTAPKAGTPPAPGTAPAPAPAPAAPNAPKPAAPNPTVPVPPGVPPAPGTPPPAAPPATPPPAPARPPLLNSSESK